MNSRYSFSYTFLFSPQLLRKCYYTLDWSYCQMRVCQISSTTPIIPVKGDGRRRWREAERLSHPLHPMDKHVFTIYILKLWHVTIWICSSGGVVKENNKNKWIELRRRKTKLGNIIHGMSVVKARGGARGRPSLVVLCRMNYTQLTNHITNRHPASDQTMSRPIIYYIQRHLQDNAHSPPPFRVCYYYEW